MTLNHANRNRNNAAAVPTPAQIRRARLAANLTAGAAGALVHERATRWAKFEDGTAHMHPAAWELFLSKVAPSVAQELAEDEPVKDTLDNLATATYYADSFPLSHSAVGKDDVASVLDVALRTRIGIACLGGRRVAIDLGNGHSLVCRTEANA